ncbi:helix-turn-helix transcriptional regulator [Paenochrobactrum sp. BZR 588]|uniref:helix-turn-helix transcriptional regulator n=1 Tax=unclassified Paenochrobactrum TaxID=2639760 RepID=UPI00385408EE
MKYDLVHFPNFKDTFFGQKFKGDILTELQRIKLNTGCKHIVHAFCNCAFEGTKIADSDITVVATVPATWVARYSAKNYFAVDPLFNDNIPVVTGDGCDLVQDMSLMASDNPAASAMYKDATKHGIGSLFIAVSTLYSNGISGCSSFSFDETEENRCDFVVRMRPVLLEASRQLHAISAGEGTVQSPQAALLTAREIECLTWAAIGKTDGEIAEILSIARWTVVTYLQNAKIKLGCSNRTAAVAAALTLGIIKEPEVSHLI